MSIFRNICAHDERLYNTKLKGTEITSSLIHKDLRISKDKNGKYNCGINDVFALLICVKQLLPDSDQEVSDLILQIDEKIKKLERRIHTVEIIEILNLMGFPENWNNLINISQ